MPQYILGLLFRDLAISRSFHLWSRADGPYQQFTIPTLQLSWHLMPSTIVFISLIDNVVCQVPQSKEKGENEAKTKNVTISLIK